MSWYLWLAFWIGFSVLVGVGIGIVLRRLGRSYPVEKKSTHAWTGRAVIEPAPSSVGERRGTHRRGIDPSLLEEEMDRRESVENSRLAEREPRGFLHEPRPLRR